MHAIRIGKPKLLNSTVYICIFGCIDLDFLFLQVLALPCTCILWKKPEAEKALPFPQMSMHKKPKARAKSPA